MNQIMCHGEFSLRLETHWIYFEAMWIVEFSTTFLVAKTSFTDPHGILSVFFNRNLRSADAVLLWAFKVRKQLRIVCLVTFFSLFFSISLIFKPQFCVAITNDLLHLNCTERSSIPLNMRIYPWLKTLNYRPNEKAALAGCWSYFHGMTVLFANIL